MSAPGCASESSECERVGKRKEHGASTYESRQTSTRRTCAEPLRDPLTPSTHTHTMASLLAATGAVAATTLALRFSLRSAAKNGARLSPWMQALAGTHGGKEDWVKGGFLAKMTPEEASQILGLRCVPPSSSTCRDGDDPGGNPLRGPARPAGLRCNHAAPHSDHALTRLATLQGIAHDPQSSQGRSPPHHARVRCRPSPSAFDASCHVLTQTCSPRSNHPDRGGSPYIASKVNEAKVRPAGSPLSLGYVLMPLYPQDMLGVLEGRCGWLPWLETDLAVPPRPQRSVFPSRRLALFHLPPPLFLRMCVLRSTFWSKSLTVPFHSRIALFTAPLPLFFCSCSIPLPHPRSAPRGTGRCITTPLSLSLSSVLSLSSSAARL